jgi:desulfoferrodoxin-like iron-binding protein
MENSQVYKCFKCEVLVTVLSKGKGQSELSCCGEKMVNVTPSEAKRVVKQYGMAAPGAP